TGVQTCALPISDSVPDHRTYSLHEHIQDVEIVSDLSELEGTENSSGDQTILEELTQDLDQEISSLATDKSDVDNGKGSYQVLKVTTTEPFPQVLNYLAHQSAGIVSEEQVTAINTYDVESYDVNKDIAYGDQTTVTKGSKYDNQFYASGPYILVEKDDYEANFVRNPGYMADTDHAPQIDHVTMSFIRDDDSKLAA